MQYTETSDLVLMSAELVAAYVSNNRVSPHELATLITQVHGAFVGLSGEAPTSVEEQPITKPTSAQIRKSITPDAIISFIDGRPYKTLKRHLSTHGLDTYSYRERYGLPKDYPLVASSYAAQRSALAKSIGLGQPRRQADPELVGDSAGEKAKRASAREK